MWTVAEIAKKTKTKPEAVRYFARTYNVAKLKIKNRYVYIFDKKDLACYRFYIGEKREKENDKQLVFEFYEQQVERKQHKRNLQSEGQKKMCAILKKAGDLGVNRHVLCVKLGISDLALEKLLSLDPYLPIGEDDRIDDKIYWII